jgi:hypothetical protein
MYGVRILMLIVTHNPGFKSRTSTAAVVLVRGRCGETGKWEMGNWGNGETEGGILFSKTKIRYKNMSVGNECCLHNSIYMQYFCGFQQVFSRMGYLW